MPRKILFIIDTLQTGGAEKSILAIAEKLTKVRPVVCTLFTKKTDLEQAYLDAGIPVYKLNLPSGQFKWWSEGRVKLRALVNEIDPSAIHAHLYKSELLARTSRLDSRIPLIGAFVNDSYAAERYQQQSFVQNLKLNLYKHIDAYTAKRVDYFTSITNAIALTNCEALAIPMAKVQTIYRGRNIDQFKSHHPTYSAGEDVFVFQVVARLLVRKGYLELIEAVALLRENGRHRFTINVAGDGVDAALIKAKAKDAGVSDYISFLGNRDDVPELLSSAHCFLFPSHYEGQGGALIEAMLSAKPIIATDIAVFKEQVQPDVSGMLFNIRDAEDMARKMLAMMDNYENGVAMGNAALREAKQRFDINTVAQQYDAFYQQVIGSKLQ